MGAGCSSPAPSPPGVAPFALAPVAPAESTSPPPARAEASDTGNLAAPASSSADDAHDAPQDRNTIRLLRAVEGNAIAQMKKILEDGVDLGRRLPGKEVQDFLLREHDHFQVRPGERYVVKTGAGYDSVAADELSADAKRCLLYTSPSPRDKRQSRMPSSA